MPSKEADDKNVRFLPFSRYHALPFNGYYSETGTKLQTHLLSMVGTRIGVRLAPEKRCPSWKIIWKLRVTSKLPVDGATTSAYSALLSIAVCCAAMPVSVYLKRTLPIVIHVSSQ